MVKRIEAKLLKISNLICYSLVQGMSRLFLSLFFRITLTGLENVPKRGRFILAANHQNFLDGFLLSQVVSPFKKVTFIIAKRALKFKPWRILFKSIGSVLIGNDIEDYQRVLKKLNRILSHGEPVAIFPEGDISKGKIPRKFKGGVAKLSIDSTTKVVPVYIDNTYNLRYLKFWFKRSKISVRVGKPIELYNYAKDYKFDLEKIANYLRAEILKLAGLKEVSFEVSRSKIENFNNTQAKDVLSSIEKIGVK